MPETPKRPEPQSRTVTPFVFLDNSRPVSRDHPSGTEPSFKNFVAAREAEKFRDDVPEIDDSGSEADDLD